MDLAALGTKLANSCTLHGDFVLRSGATTDLYFDKYQFEADPQLLREVAQALVELIPPETDVLAGLELGGVPIAAALSQETGLALALVRKTAKTYGTAKLAEGASITGRRVVLIEDVVTTGGQILESLAHLRNEGAIIDTALCVLDRGANDHRQFSAQQIQLRSLYRASDIGW